MGSVVCTRSTSVRVNEMQPCTFYEALFHEFLSHCKGMAPRQSGQRGRVAESDAHNLWERLKRHERAVLLFARNAHIAFTNKRCHTASAN